MSQYRRDVVGRGISTGLGLGLRKRLQSGAPATEPVNFGGGGSPPVLSRGSVFTGMVDTKIWSFSVWIRPVSVHNGRIFVSPDGSIEIRYNSSNRIQVLGSRVIGGTGLNVQSSAGTPVVTGNWTHIHGYFDMSDQPSSDLEINGVAGIAVSAFLDFDLNFVTSPTDYLLGAANTGGSAFFDGDMADFWFDQSFVSDNSLFFSPGRTPVNPLQPGIVRMTGALADWPTNKGTGGGMTSNGDPLLPGQTPIVAP